MGEAAKLIFGQPVMIDGFALNSSDVPVRHFALLDEVAETVNARGFSTMAEWCSFGAKRI